MPIPTGKKEIFSHPKESKDTIVETILQRHNDDEAVEHGT
jgi:hypothetical protein